MMANSNRPHMGGLLDGAGGVEVIGMFVLGAVATVTVGFAWIGIGGAELEWVAAALMPWGYLAGIVVSAVLIVLLWASGR